MIGRCHYHDTEGLLCRRIDSFEIQGPPSYLPMFSVDFLLLRARTRGPSFVFLLLLPFLVCSPFLLILLLFLLLLHFQILSQLLRRKMGLGKTVRGFASCTQFTLQSLVRGSAWSEAFYKVIYTPFIKTKSTLARCYFTPKKRIASNSIGGCNYSSNFNTIFKKNICYHLTIALIFFIFTGLVKTSLFFSSSRFLQIPKQNTD